jgi:Rrf2 family transcriptional regulator, iron-sulfur cluster assembly transcription factor
MLSHTVEYALRASIYVARQAPRFVPVAEVADNIGAPRNYLGKILTQLARAGFLDSVRGAAGGFRLTANAAARPLSEIVALIEKREPQRCLLGLGICGEQPDCSAHHRWRPVAETTNAFFAHTTLNDLLYPPEARTTPPSSDAFHPLLSNSLRTS